MIITRSSALTPFTLIAALIMWFGPVSTAFSQVYSSSYIVDLNNSEVTKIGNLGSYSNTATAINDIGQVAGFSNMTSGFYSTRAFITGPNGVGIRDIGTLGGSNSVSTGINEMGQVVGYADTSGNRTHAFITGPNGEGVTDLFPWVDSSMVKSVNNAGQVTGEIYTYFSSGPFITGPNGKGAGGPLMGEAPAAINSTGQVAGYFKTETVYGEHVLHAFITGPNGMGLTDLGTLGLTDSMATGINDFGQVVGYTSTMTGKVHAFITGANGAGMTDIAASGALDSFSSYATGINNAGQVVGYYVAIDAVTGENTRHAFITGPNGVGMTDLGALIKLPDNSASYASDINNSGQVIINIIPSIPEPKIYAMVLAGLIMLSYFMRRKERVDAFSFCEK
jgi:probable HAF family extracellular repeat protein